MRKKILSSGSFRGKRNLDTGSPDLAIKPILSKDIKILIDYGRKNGIDKTIELLKEGFVNRLLDMRVMVDKISEILGVEKEELRDILRRTSEPSGIRFQVIQELNVELLVEQGMLTIIELLEQELDEPYQDKQTIASRTAKPVKKPARKLKTKKKGTGPVSRAKKSSSKERELKIEDIGVLIQYAITGETGIDEAIKLLDQALVYKYYVETRDEDNLNELGFNSRRLSAIELELYPVIEMVAEVSKTLDLDFLIKCGRESVSSMLKGVVFSYALENTIDSSLFPNKSPEFDLGVLREHNQQQLKTGQRPPDPVYSKEEITKKLDLIISYGYENNLRVATRLLEELFLARHKALKTKNKEAALGVNSKKLKKINYRLIKIRSEIRDELFQQMDMDFLLQLGLRRAKNELRKGLSTRFFESVQNEKGLQEYKGDQIPNKEDLRIPALYGLTFGMDEARKVLTGGLIRAALQKCDSLDGVAKMLGITRDQVLIYYKTEYWEERQGLQSTGFDALIEYGLSERDLNKAYELLKDMIKTDSAGSSEKTVKVELPDWQDEDMPQILKEMEPFILLGMKGENARKIVIRWLKAELMEAVIRQHGDTKSAKLLGIHIGSISRIRKNRPRIDNAPHIGVDSILLRYALDEEYGLRKTIKGFDKELILRAIAQKDTKEEAASMMGIANSTMSQLTKNYGLRESDKPVPKPDEKETQSF
ncbi:hypothetical protein ACFL4D_01400 [Candidatus Margulisiibacteriota bacterium]